jgi:ABC-type proline/glycine betaine transport system permease subunit
MELQMNPLNKNASKAYKIAAIAIFIALAVASALAFTWGFESDIRYFKDSPLTVVLVIPSVAALGLAFSSLFVFKGQKATGHPEPLFRFVAMLPMIAMIRLIIHFIWSEYSRLAQSSEKATLDVWVIFIVITAVFSAIYNLSEIFEMNKPLKLISGLMQIIFCIIAIASLYVDFTVELNSPVKLLIQFSAAAMLLCMLADLRKELDLPNAAAFILSRICSVSMGLVSAVALFAEILPNADKYLDSYSVYSLVFIACGIKSAVEYFSSPINNAVGKKAEDEIKEPCEDSESASGKNE